MNVTIKIATTDAERRAIFRLRYEIYVEEMKIFGAVADHTLRLLADTNDPDARLMYAAVDGEVVATLRLNMGKDAPFSDEFNKTYSLGRFRQAVADEQIMVLTRFMVKKEHRGSSIAFRMIAQVARIGLDEGIELAFCDCQPHLIRFYNRIGFRGYECPVYDDPEFGIMVPLVFVYGDVPYLKANRSPVHAIIAAGSTDAEMGRRIVGMLGHAPVRSSEDVRVSDHSKALYEAPFFEGLEPEEVQAVASWGYVIDCTAGDRVIRQGQTQHNVFVVLSGSLEVCGGDNLVTEVKTGDVVGETSFLLSTNRATDVYAGSQGACVLSLDEQRFRRMLETPSRVSALLLHNMSKTLARKLTGMMESSLSPYRTGAPALSMAA